MDVINKKYDWLAKNMD